MKILVNYDAREQAYIPVLQHYLKKEKLQAIATNLTLTIGQLLDKAKAANCDGILIINENTLRNLVPDDKATLDAYRGSLLTYSVPTVITNPIAHTHSVEHGAFLLENDLSKFYALSKLKKKEVFNYTVLTQAEYFIECFDKANKSIAISYDIETKTVNEDEENNIVGQTIITCCSWTLINPDLSLNTYVLPLVDFLQDHWHTDEDYIKAIQFMKDMNALKQTKVMHNGMYDCLHSIVYNAEPKNWTVDTMALAHAQYVSLPKTLDFVASITIPDYCQWKHEAAESASKRDINEYWGYNAKDTWYTARIFLHYIYNIPEYAKINYGLSFKLTYPALYCAFEGILIDNTIRKEKRDVAEKIVEENRAFLRTYIADPNFNPGSWQQIQKYVYDVFGAADPHIGSKKKDGKRKKTVRGTDAKNLTAVGQQHPLLLRFTSKIIEYKENQKAIGTYYDFLQLNSRLLYSLNPFGTETNRMACGSSSFWCGTQVQNIPSYAKPMLIADEGYELIEADNSQSEARCTGYLSKEWNLVKALETPGKDFYKTLGTLFFGIPYEEVSTEFRNLVLKKIVHGTNYVMGAITFIENATTENLLKGATILQVKVTMDKKKKAGDDYTLTEFAGYLLDKYHEPFKRVREWYKEVALEITTTKMLQSPTGLTRYFFGNPSKDHSVLRSAVAHGPQHLSVGILNIGFWKAWCLTKESNGEFRLKAQIHDSILAQILATKRVYYAGKLYDSMQNPMIVNGRNMVIPVEMKIGKSWGSMEKYSITKEGD